MLYANISEKGESKAEKAPADIGTNEINAEMAELDAMKTTSPDIGSVADIGVQAAMEFLTADKVIVSHEDAENDMKQVKLDVKLKLSLPVMYLIVFILQRQITNISLCPPRETSQEEFVPAKEVDRGERILDEEGMRDPVIETKDENVEVQIILEQDFRKAAELGKDETGDVVVMNTLYFNIFIIVIVLFKLVSHMYFTDTEEEEN